jgi:large subunit ribosomal protein L31
VRLRRDLETGSTKKELRVEVCSQCHPFITGKQSLLTPVDVLIKFKKKYGIK